MSGREVTLQAPVKRGRQPQIDVVPEDRGITFGLERRAGQTPRVSVFFHHVQPGFERRGMDEARDLAEATTEIGH